MTELVASASVGGLALFCPFYIIVPTDHIQAFKIAGVCIGRLALLNSFINTTIITYDILTVFVTSIGIGGLTFLWSFLHIVPTLYIEAL